jgi:hypothetical protein
MLTILEINRALDRLGDTALIPRTRRRRATSPETDGGPSREPLSARAVTATTRRVDASRSGAASPAAIPEPVVLGPAGALELQPEIILPEQLDDLGRRCKIPEHRLMLAVLEDAVAVFKAGCVSQHLGSRPLFRDTAAWFASDDTSSPFSFVTICELFAIDPDYLRSGLRRWQAWHADRTADGRRASFAFRRVSGIRHRLTGPRLRRRA